MARARGFKGFLGIGKETAWGTPVALTNYLRFKSESLTHEKDTVFDQALGSLHRRGPFDGKTKGSGDVTTNLQYNGLEFLLYNLFGYNPTPAVVTTVGTWTWSSNAGAAVPPVGLTLSVNRDIAKFLYSGCKVSAATFKMIPADIAEVTWSIVSKGLSSTSDTPDTASYPNDQPVLATYGALKFNAETPARVNVKSGSLTVKNIYDEDSYGVTANTILEPVRLGMEMSGEFTLWFQARADYTLFSASSDVNVGLVYTSPVLISGSTYYSMTFTVPKNRITPTADPVIGGRGLIEQPMKLETYYDDSAEPFLLTIVNAMVTAL